MLVPMIEEADDDEDEESRINKEVHIGTGGAIRKPSQ
jgi:hypothetical protein